MRGLILTLLFWSFNVFAARTLVVPISAWRAAGGGCSTVDFNLSLHNTSTYTQTVKVDLFADGHATVRSMTGAAVGFFFNIAAQFDCTTLFGTAGIGGYRSCTNKPTHRTVAPNGSFSWWFSVLQQFSSPTNCGPSGGGAFSDGSGVRMVITVTENTGYLTGTLTRDLVSAPLLGGSAF